MKILIDADGCPVVKETVNLSIKYNIECKIICDTSHHFDIEGIETVVVSKGADSVDFKLVNMISPSDIVITQDYALAAMCLAKKAVAINQNGLVFNDNNILSLLNQRYVSQRIRRSGGRVKGFSARKPEQNEFFCQTLESILKNNSC